MIKKIYFRFLTAAFVLISGVSAADIDFKLYGAGPMVKPGASYYVSSAGSDSNDGKSLKKAWRTLKRGVRDLKAGDTLYVAEGVYNEGGISLNYGVGANFKKQWGKPGSPIRVMGMSVRKPYIS